MKPSPSSLRQSDEGVRRGERRGIVQRGERPLGIAPGGSDAEPGAQLFNRRERQH